MAQLSKHRIVAADIGGITQAVQRLREGKVVVVPSESVYGLAANAFSESAIAMVYRIKQRQSDKPLLVISTPRQLKQLANVDRQSAELLKKFTGQAITVILQRRPASKLASKLCAADSSIAVRLTRHPILLRLLDQLAFPLALPSANRSRALPALTAQAAAACFQDLAESLLIIDAGPSPVTTVSTIVDARQPGKLLLLRSGAVSPRQLSSAMPQLTLHTVAATGSITEQAP